MKYNIEEKLQTKKARELYLAVSKLESKEAVADFLRDVLTFNELDEMISRFNAAKMLSEGEGVRKVARETKMSSATISRINYWIHHGTGGYGLALERLK